MQHPFSRMEMIVGAENLKKLQESTVAVCGIGGVGSYVVEALARCGLGNLVLVDSDIVSLTNINRQIHATTKTVGLDKVQVMKERILEIHPSLRVRTAKVFLTEETIPTVLGDCDYIVDAIDTVTAKLALVVYADKEKIPIISSMGTGNKFHPERLELADIYETSICPLAKVMRKELRKRNISALRVCYSKEEPVVPASPPEEEVSQKRQTPGSISFVPSTAGLLIAGQVVRDLLGID